MQRPLSGDFFTRLVEYWVQTRLILSLFLETAVSSHSCCPSVKVQEGTVGIKLQGTELMTAVGILCSSPRLKRLTT